MPQSVSTAVSLKASNIKDLEPVYGLVTDEFAAVNALIPQRLTSDVSLVEDIGSYIVKSGGKRLRPLLVLLGVGSLGYRGADHVKLAAIIEFLHTATLLHDDVVDHSEMRRGRLTANEKWGNAPSVLVGDFLYSRAFQLMVELGNMPIMDILATATNTIAEGEVKQLANIGNTGLSEADYRDVIRAKTALLFQAATHTAALLAQTADRTIDAMQVNALRDFGCHFGLSFQLVDDWLDYAGDSATMGKNVGDDLAEGKLTLPLIRILATGSRDAQQAVCTAIADKNPAMRDTIIDVVHASDALDYTQQAAQHEADLALSCLDALPPTTAYGSHAHANALWDISALLMRRALSATHFVVCSAFIWASLVWSTSAWPDIAFEPCLVKGNTGHLQAECAHWQRPLNPADANSAPIDLFVTRLSATALEAQNDPLTVINGGPGGSSIDLLVDYQQVLRMFTRQRDVIVIDQRGTGRSTPLTCPNLTDTVTDVTPDEVAALTQTCLDALPADPRYFTTSVAVDDLEALRVAMGYDALNMYGVSYGTRVAQHYAQRYPSTTRTLILDGVIPSHRALGLLIAQHSQNALNTIFADCSANAACAAAFPELEDSFNQLRNRLQRAPVALSIPHPVTGQVTDITLNHDHLAMYVRFSLYAPETRAVLPVVLHEAAHAHHYLPLAANALRIIHDMSNAINYGMHNAVVCTEDTPHYDDKTANVAAMAQTYLGTTIYETLRQLCSIWPVGVTHDSIKQPLANDIPTLVLSGEYDPITPPSWGTEVAATLPNALHLVAPKQGHGVFARGCLPQLLRDFVESGTWDGLETSCVDALTAFPFFTDSLGPPP